MASTAGLAPTVRSILSARQGLSAGAAVARAVVAERPTVPVTTVPRPMVPDATAVTLSDVVLVIVPVKVDRKNRCGLLLNHRQPLFHAMWLVHQGFVLRGDFFVGDMTQPGLAALKCWRSQGLVILLWPRQIGVPTGLGGVDHTPTRRHETGWHTLAACSVNRVRSRRHDILQVGQKFSFKSLLPHQTNQAVQGMDRRCRRVQVPLTHVQNS